MPRVSVITATYNRSEVLRWAIESVRRQSFTDWEHIIVCDACTDDSVALAESFADPRLRIINRPENFGEQSVPNNEGVSLASGALVAYLNHDDLWFPDHLASLTSAIDALGADLVYAPPVSIDAAGVARCGDTNAELRYDPSHFVPASLWLLKRALAVELGGWRPARAIHASNPSQDFLVRAWRRGSVLACAPHVTALLLPSGSRPNAYVERDGAQQAALHAALGEPGFRERLLTQMVLTAERDAAALRHRPPSWRSAARWAVDRLLIAARLHPDAIRNRVRRRPRGHWIDHMRAFRGLPPAPKPGARE